MEKKRTSLKESFTDIMIKSILSGELNPGDRIDAERTLAEQFGISRGSVNQGLLDLERMGFVEIVPRKGAYVADFMLSSSPDTIAAIMSYDSALVDSSLFKDLMDMRILVEKESARLAAKNINAAEIAAINSCTNRIYSAGDSELGDAIFEYHLQVVKASGNKAYLLLFKSFEKMVRRLIEKHYYSKNEICNTLPLYEKLTEEIVSGNLQNSEKCMEDILSHAEKFLDKVL